MSATSASVYILRDVSERKRLEETQAGLRREQALAEMSAMLAHEIRNPLGSLELFAGLLAESRSGPRVPEMGGAYADRSAHARRDGEQRPALSQPAAA